MASKSETTRGAKTSEPKPVQYVIGVLGTTSDLKMELQRAIKAKGTNWHALGQRMSVTRQALCSSVDSERVSFASLQRICAELGINPFDFFEVMEPERNQTIL